MPRKNFVSNKAGIVLGIAITLSIIGAINLVSVSSAHDNGNNGMMHSGMMQMMHSMMGNDMTNDGNSMMGRIPMDQDQMSEEDINKMLKEMDKDNDGLCDHCGMALYACREMMT